VIAVFLRERERQPLVKVAALAVASVAVVGLGIVLVSATFQSPPAAADAPEQENLRRLGQALLRCHEGLGSFPSAVQSDGHGHIMHSWRVSVLPFLGAGEIYRDYDFSQPWNGPHNQALASRMPDVFRSPSDAKTPATDTSYLRVYGGGTAGGGPDEAPDAPAIPDGMASTILVVEVARSGISWLEAKDITVQELLERANKPGFGPHEGGFYALFCDGTVRFIHTPIDLETLRRLASRNDGKPVDLDKL
jgi:hypothetical protein